MTDSSSTNPPWATRVKAVLVSSSTRENPSVAGFRLAYDRITNQGCISLSIKANLSNRPSGEEDTLILRIPPESVKTCSLISASDETLCSDYFASKLPTRVKNVRDVSTLTLELVRAPAEGTVLCSSEMSSLLPAAHGDWNFAAFARVCEFTSLRIHFAARQFVGGELGILKTLVRGLETRSLRAVSFDNSRQGLVEIVWKDLNVSLERPPDYEEPAPEQVKQVDPPPYNEEPKSAHVGGKRARDYSLMPSSEDDRRKRPLFTSPEPPCCPTEVNTPSTLPPSPASIRPTEFTRRSSPSRTERDTLARLEHMLSGASADLIRKLLIRLAYRCLQAPPGDPEDHLLSDFEKFPSARMESMERRLERIVEEKMKFFIEPHILDAIIDSAVSECRDQFLDECHLHETEFRDQVEDGNAEVRITANDCMKEMEEQAQRHLEEIREQAQQHMHKIEDQGIEAEISVENKVAKLKHELKMSARSLPGREARLTSQEISSPKGRRSSI
ncbi:hypothetical protein ASPACDRAFT_113624 [Aspergillus aculeatus ATCC 16872]|uniref:Uncharacterized protein n=1 Tax=Aspergillus aculeatus (strain ATCC 16872 / CBS 172.66 / WB 5094) TaxID=690307 RepID=A0A1L9X3G8_ASPA1|nr:uncharacterized protein ASPACDRAFT_113624 [Aspergillus aculeatus ATCC 16872]OJK03021.1 hypothetical protein ASPACDRAFT_113624 [Aspergillus aculeatus ATCC 16872]